MTTEPGDCCPGCKDGVEQGRRKLDERAVQLDALIRDKLKSPSINHRRKAEHGQLSVNFIAKSGDEVLLTLRSEYLFRCEKIIFTENNPGSVMVRKLYRTSDGKSQLYKDAPIEGYSASEFFPANSLGCGIMLDPIDPGDSFTFVLTFKDACEGTIWMGGMVVKP